MSDFVKHHVGHHFQDANEEFESAKLGTWLFLAQEILFFGALFVAYTVFRLFYPETWLEGSKYLDTNMGLTNTIVLLLSSFTMVMAVRATQLSQKKETIIFLSITLLCGFVFMGIKYMEYMHKIEYGYLPSGILDMVGKNFGHGKEETLPLFFGLYYTVTGLHGLHVIIGMGLIVWMIVKASLGQVHADYFTPVEMVGLYWHLVDLVWIFLFPLLYLI